MTGRRNWTVPVLGLAAVLLFGYVGTHRDPVRRPEPRPTATPAPVLPRLDGTPGAGPAGLRLLVDGGSPRIVDAATGGSVPVPGLRLAAGQRARLRAVPSGTLATLVSAGLPPVRTVLVRAAGRPVDLGGEVDAVPAATGTDLWVGARVPTGTRASRLDVTGAVRATWTSRYRLALIRDTPAGLVVGRTGHAAGTEVLLLDPRTGVPRRTLATTAIPLAVSDTALATAPTGCEDTCVVEVTDLRTGDVRAYPLSGATPDVAAFSADGGWLALGVPGQYRNGRLAVQPGSAHAVNIRTGAVYEVPGVGTGPDDSPDLSWSGGTLVLAVWSAERGRIALWSPDRRGPLTVLPVEPRGDPNATVTALP